MLGEADGNVICWLGEDFGDDFSRDPELLRDAAEQGDPSAQYGIGYCYEHGIVVEEDYETAVFWYAMAAAHGNPMAQRNLGDCYYYGRGVKTDHAVAALWYRNAADQKSGHARKMLRRIEIKKELKTVWAVFIYAFIAFVLLGVALELFGAPEGSDILSRLKEVVYPRVFLFQNFPDNFLIVPVALLSFALHELSHATVAYRLGDRSVDLRRRVTINPIKHIAPLGAILISVFGFGWAKPVTFDPDKFEDPRAAIALIAAAGPISNFVLAFLSAISMQVLIYFEVYPHVFISQCFFITFWLNILLGILNALPLLPFDGSKILMAFLPRRRFDNIIKGESTAFIVLSLCSIILVLVFMFSGAFSRTIGKVIFSSEAYLRYNHWVDVSSARSGDMAAQNILGNYYYIGEFVAQDFEQATYWYRKAAENGFAWAQLNLGSCYMNGQGVEQSYEQAVYWYKMAAEQGNPSAMTRLGMCYYSGRGVLQDFEMAAFWLSNAAELGNPGAQYRLGNCYYYGDGVEKDDLRAHYWYTKAAEQGVQEAIDALRMMQDEK